ncbi:head-tail connector protein [Sphingomonas cavernae]|uniref:Phage gp6-like head-tail connector protein n=1 Tax=Sphingomonas cavernae TaxID=2320861 RepID=A0A418WLE5_9SPHN|nr:head-tail connector protein [Sphingomonas cavernae]RJF90782.1 hypothetical protein D3876_11355 [Sphingomonas cavernae]
MAAGGEAPVSIAEVKAFLRIENGDEDALIAGLIRSATEMCERFTGLALIARSVEEVVPAVREWRRLGMTPARAITSLIGLPADGASFALPVDAYAVDIDANGDGWVRVMRPGAAGCVRVSYEAGLAADWNGVPEALRQGIVRLVAHLFTHRDGKDDAGPPAAVTALWRPWRRMRMSEGTHDA